MTVFKIGDIVTIKSHPLFSVLPKKINEFPSQVPPLMLIKEILYEKADKKKIYSDEIKNAQVADLVKYNCTYFNANKSVFEEKTIYHSILEIYSKLKYYRVEEKGEKKIAVSDKKLIKEVLTYKDVKNYEYSKRVQFKTKKLEQRKSYSTFTERIPGSSFQTPDFILVGVKNEDIKDLFYPDGKPKRLVSKQSFKVMWFNHFQQKFSEEYLPKEFFVEGLDI
jgi:hypothetical protein